MIPLSPTFLIATTIAITSSFPAPSFAETATAENLAIVPVSRFDNRTWSQRHRNHVKLALEGGIDVLFLGDSLTANWEKFSAVWDHHYGQMRATAFGIGGDQTEHLLWRLRNGELDGLAPKVVVLLIGANNMSQKLQFSPPQIAEGVSANLQEIRHRLPAATIIILVSVLPRTTPMNEWLNEKTLAVNSLIRPMANGQQIIYLDLWPVLLGPDGEADTAAFRDNTHLNAEGYDRFAKALEPLVAHLRPLNSRSSQLND